MDNVHDDSAQPVPAARSRIRRGAALAGTAATAVAAGRVALGLAALARPAVPARPWVGESADDLSAQVLGRALGARDLALGLGALAALRQPRPAAAGWLAAGALSDALDVAATAAAWSRLPPRTRWLVAASAGGAALAGAAGAVAALAERRLSPASGTSRSQAPASLSPARTQSTAGRRSRDLDRTNESEDGVMGDQAACRASSPPAGSDTGRSPYPPPSAGGGPRRAFRTAVALAATAVAVAATLAATGAPATAATFEHHTATAPRLAAAGRHVAAPASEMASVPQFTMPHGKVYAGHAALFNAAASVAGGGVAGLTWTVTGHGVIGGRYTATCASDTSEMETSFTGAGTVHVSLRLSYTSGARSTLVTHQLNVQNGSVGPISAKMGGQATQWILCVPGPADPAQTPVLDGGPPAGCQDQYFDGNIDAIGCFTVLADYGRLPASDFKLVCRYTASGCTGQGMT